MYLQLIRYSSLFSLHIWKKAPQANPTFSHQNYYVGKKFITTYPTTTYIPYYRFINGNAPQKLSHPNWSDNFSRFSLLEKRFAISMDPLKWVMLLMLPLAVWKILNQNWTQIGKLEMFLKFLKDSTAFVYGLQTF